MKQYAKEIQDATEKIVALKNIGKAYSSSLVQSDLNKLQKAISFKDESGAEKAAAKLTGELKTIEVPTETNVGGVVSSGTYSPKKNEKK